MTFVVTENCIKCKYMDCVEVCPVDCFHEGPNSLTIDPDECIDCTLCEPECPIEAIFSEEELPAGQEHYKQMNAELAKHWPVRRAEQGAPAPAAPPPPARSPPPPPHAARHTRRTQTGAPAGTQTGTPAARSPAGTA